jgi:hypothetical protein
LKSARQRKYDRDVGAAVSHTGRRASLVGDGARVLLALVRIANGTLGLVAPSVISRPLTESDDLDAHKPAHYPFRLFGIRTVIIGAELLSRDAYVRERAVRVALPIHATDTVSAALGGLLGELPAKTAVRLAALSGTNTLLALLARRTLR